MAESDPAPAESIKLHLYCHGLGDCLLLEIPKKDGEPFWMLIDCGIHTSAKGGTDTIRRVVEDLHEITKGRLDVIVGTHEHWDHISGFLQAEDLFRKFDVGEVWFAWTENPTDPDGRQLDKYKSDAAEALELASSRLSALAGIDGAEDDSEDEGEVGAEDSPEERARQSARRSAKDINSLLGFVFGAKGERSRDARERLRALSSTVRHLEPGTMAPLPTNVESIRVFVLAPPRDKKLLGVTDSDVDTYRFGIGASPMASALRNGLALGQGWLGIHEDPLAPFDAGVGRPLTKALSGDLPITNPEIAFLSAHYAGDAHVRQFRLEPGETGQPPTADQGWRRIDNGWLDTAGELALQLDSRTNNSSLVLAIEIVATGRVLIFAADAQVGNWRSWKDVTFPPPLRSPRGTVPVTGAELLKRTVFYKVGHHGSRNATLSKDGLELMTDPDLVAFIPTDEKMAKKVRWSDIPATRLLSELQRKTGGRVIQSDKDWLQTEGVPLGVRKGGALKSDPVVVPKLRVTLEIG